MFLAVRCTITGRFRVCHNKRITRNKMFRDYAERGKSTMGWCFGFKLHLICNERGELLNFIPNRSVDLNWQLGYKEKGLDGLKIAFQISLFVWFALICVSKNNLGWIEQNYLTTNISGYLIESFCNRAIASSNASSG